MQPLIYAKSEVKEPNIECKLGIEADGIELQLLGELYNFDTKEIKKATDIFNLSKFEKYPITVVHSPLQPGYGDITLEMMCGCQEGKLLDQVCFIANYFGSKQHKQITVVVHTEMYLGFLKALGEPLDKITFFLQRMLEIYPYIRIGIENVTPCKLKNDGVLRLANNYKFDNVELVNYFRDRLHTTRIGTVLDTCHAMLAKKYLMALYTEIGDRITEDYTLNAYFEANKDVCFLIHLADYAGSGYGPKRHGILFTPDRAYKCNEILGLYHKYKYSCPITIEVSEDDYLVCDSYRKTREIVLSCSNFE